MDIAIVGIGCRFPGGADSPGKFWQLLCSGVDAIAEVPPERFDVEELFDPGGTKAGTLSTRWGGFVDDIDRFDAAFFGISPREAHRIDPQHRMLLEVVWEALEDAGLPPDGLAGSNTGVFIGVATGDYGRMQLDPANRHLVDAYACLGTAASISANRISYHFDFRGPSLAVDTACSSSLVAVHLAARSIAAGESEIAVVGGANALLTPEPAIGFSQAGMLSPEGRCRAFDAGADGYVRAEGAGAVVLKPLEAAIGDQDPIHAVLRGSAVNSDGHTVGITVPSSAAQEAMMRAALRDAGLDATDVQYIEAHGTGTPVGDPLEADAIGAAYGQGRLPGEPCLMGSVKTNIGHLEAAAGIAGLIKATLALEHRQVPPHLHLREPNPAIPFEKLRLRIPTTLEPWPHTHGGARAAVNSFGFGGTNAHVVVEEPPAAVHRAGESDDSGAQLLTLSARNDGALEELAARYRDLLRSGEPPPLADICYTAALRRTHHDHRLAVVASTRHECAEKLNDLLSEAGPAATAAGKAQRDEPRLAFVFTGMGPLWWGMGRQLMRSEPVYRAKIEECDRVLQPISPWSLLDELNADEAGSRVTEPDRAQVVNTAVQVALAELWRSWGIAPDAVIGHSAGELAAACVAGAITLPDALHIAYHRGRLQRRASGSGTMLAAGISETVARKLIEDHGDELSVAAVNSPTSVTLSGTAAALDQVATELARRDVFTRFLPVTVPYHGPQMDPLRAELLAALAAVTPRSTGVPIASVVTGGWIDGTDLDAGYWWRNVRHPVRFADAADTLAESGYTLFVEVGPHPVLAPSLRECLAARQRAATVLPTLRRDEDERAVPLATLSQLYVRGRKINWAGVFARGGRSVRLPSYPWQRERHWFEPVGPSRAAARTTGVPSGHPLLGVRLNTARPIWHSELGHASLGYLDGHRLGDSAVFPAAGYVETALAAAREIQQGETVGLRHLQFLALLDLASQDAVALECLHQPAEGTLEIHSAGVDAPADWTLHASARIGPPPGEAGAPLDVAAVRRRCATERTAEDYYRRLEERGYHYRDAFRGISVLWHGDGEALARIETPAEYALSTDGYLVHPALLDAAFQVLLAADIPADLTLSSEEHSSPTRLPVAIERVDLYRSPGTRFLAHAQIGPDGTGKVVLADDTGAVSMSCEGLRLRTVGRPRGPSSEIDDCRYELRWHERPHSRPSLTPEVVLDRVRPAVARRAEEERWADYYREFEPSLDALVRHFARAALRHLGWRAEAEAEISAPDPARLGIAPQHHRYAARLMEIVQAGGSSTASPADEKAAAQALADGLWRTHPDDRAAIEILRRNGEHLTDILRGRVDPREILFAGDALERLTAFYAGGGPLRQANPVLSEVMAALGEHHHDTPLRVVEIGAGTGGATGAVLPALPPGSVEYVFTDVSPFFLNRAKARFGDRPGVRFEVLDIESDPPPAGDYDVVLAADVVHATADVRRSLRNIRGLLRPGGMLVLLEVTRKTPWGDLMFGALEGWWRFTDTDLRPSYPLLDVPQWQALLDESGFTGAQAISEVFGERLPLQAVLVAQAAGAPSRSARDEHTGQGKHWLILADDRGVAKTTAAGLRARGDECTVIGSSDENDLTSLLREFPVGVAPAVLHLRGLDAPEPEQLSAGQLMDHQRDLACGISELVRAMETTSTYPELYLVTAGAQRVRDDDHPPRIAQSALWGLGRVLRNEHPDLLCRLVDLSADCTAREIDELVDELSGEAGDAEVAFRGSQHYTHRLERSEPGGAHHAVTHSLSPDQAAFRLGIGSPGALETVRLEEVPEIQPGPGEVVIGVRAASLNFRDVLLALDMLSPPGVDDAAATVGSPGGDCAGVVLDCGADVDHLHPGDEVVAISTGGALGSRLIADVRWVVPKPPRLTFAEAASIPAAFLTAEYALHHAARIEPGERVLIHAATGGVGLAAVRLAQRAGAQIFATAGSPEKRAFLHSLGVEHVLDSRSLAFAEEVLARTGGEGVDVVLNSLAGEAIHAGLRALKPYGRFVELGKRDLYENTQIGLLPFRRNLTFCTFDLIQLCVERPGLVAEMLTDTMARIASGAVEPLPIREFDLTEAEDALRFMAQARHIGKLVLTVDRAEYPVCRIHEAEVFHSDATYLITGGLGGAGLAMARRMIEEGARNLVLMSRSGTPAVQDAAALRALENDSRARVIIARGDVTREADVTRILDDVRATMPPLRGVMHAAMVLDDGLLGELDGERFTRVLAPKVAGAWNLHRQTLDHDLDFFVLFSSLTSVIGTVMQGNYAAANSFLDGLATYRRAVGLPGLAINWGPLGEVGYVSRHPEIRRFLEREGLLSLSPEEAFGILERSLREEASNTVAVRVDRTVRPDPSSVAGRYVSTLSTAQDPGREGTASLQRQLATATPTDRRALLRDHLVQRAARVLATAPERIESDRPLPEVGLDSLMAVELQNALKLDLGVQIAVTRLLKGASVRDLVEVALEQLALPATVENAEGRVPDGPEHSTFPLSSEQRRFWLLDQLRPGSPLSNLHAAVRLSGDLDVHALEQALNEVVRRHHILRARFRLEGREPVQVFPAPIAQPLRVVDLREAPAPDREKRLRVLAAQEVRRPFDLTEGPLLRWLLFRLGDSEHVLVVTGHHIALDPWCNTVLVGEIAQVYSDLRADRRPGFPPPEARYLDYARRQRERLRGELLRRQTDYWRGQLADAPSEVRLPTDRPRPALPTHRGGHLPVRLSGELTEALKALSRGEGVTLFMTLLAGFEAVLHRWSRQDDICVGTPVVTRGFPGGDGLVGCCINTLALRTDTSGDPTFRELLRRVQRVTLDAYDHQEVPFDLIAGTFARSRPGSMSPLFNTMLVLHGVPPANPTMPGLDVTPMQIDSGLALFDLMLVLEAGEQLNGTLEYSADLFDPGTAERLLGHFAALLTAAIADPDQRLSELALLSAEERSSVVAAAGERQIDLGAPVCVHDLVERQAIRTPDGIAVRFDGTELTYRELDRRANQLAHRLQRLGVRPETVVGVCLERSVELAVAVLAVLKAGGAYLPLDPTHPRDRLRLMAEDAGARVIVTQPRLRPGLGEHGAEVVELDPAWAALAAEPAERAPVTITPDTLAYVVYTSGSTGRPRGVLVTHGAISNQVRWRQHQFSLSPSDAVLQRTPIGFDPSVWEFFGPLSAGAGLVLPRPGDERDGAVLVNLLRAEGITALQLVPSLLEVLLEQPGVERCHALRHIFCGGEALTPALRDRCQLRLPKAWLHNLYGPAEAAIDATWWTCPRPSADDPVPIGRPIGNVTAHVLDEHLHQVPVGVPGELCLGGAGLARGYLNQPTLTRQRFVPNPFSPGTRLYRTGDVARRRADGVLEFLGRTDDQVKIRGCRVDPGEIEASLARHPSVRQAAVVTQQLRPGDHRLVAFTVIDRDPTPSPGELRGFLADRLPEHLLPAAVVLVDSLPRTAHGKVDRDVLVERHLPEEPRKVPAAPRDDLQRRLLTIWERLLDVRPIGVTDDFFALGGHSLLAMRLAATVHQELGWELPVSHVVRARTIEGLARLLLTRPAADSPLVLLHAHGSRTPFFCVHPVSGSVADYVGLAAALGEDRPCYGLQALEGQPLRRIEDMARRYLEEVRRVQPAGPYLLGGWSLGGMVAFEMARQLADTAEEVALLAVIDVWPPSPDPAEAEAETTTLWHGFASSVGLTVDTLGADVRRFWQLEVPEQLTLVREQLQAVGAAPPDAEQRCRMFVDHLRAMRDYTPRSYPGRVTLLASAELAGQAALRRWEDLAEGGLTVRTIPGDHHTMLREPHLGVLARRLRQELDAADETSRVTR